MNRILLIGSILFFSFSQIAYSQNQAWGTVGRGGTNNVGVIFKMNNDGSGYTLKSNLNGEILGKEPTASVIQASNGKLYGMTFTGGANDLGVLFEFEPASKAFAAKYSFTSVDGNGSQGGGGKMIQATNQNIYGITYSGGINANGIFYSGNGVLYEYNTTTGVYTKKHEFTDAGGINPVSLVEADNGKLYGLTSSKGSGNLGTLFEYDITTGIYVNKYDFTTSISPHVLMKSANGKLYGLIQAGFTDQGQLFEYDVTNGNFTTKVTFDGSVNMGGSPDYNLVEIGGKLYGVTVGGGANGMGIVFEYNTVTDGFIKKFDFSTSGNSLSTPLPNGNLLFTTSSYDAPNISELDINNGTLIKKSDLQIKQVPAGWLLKASDGNFYGLSQVDGLENSGTILQYNYSSRVMSASYQFHAGANGIGPSGQLVQFTDGKFYGVTSIGGIKNSGTLFQYDPMSGEYKKKVDFDAETTGYVPAGNMQLSGQKLYGTTYLGGANGSGTIYEFDPVTGVIVKKHDFEESTGAYPTTTVAVVNGKIYGMASSGGANGYGVIYEFNPADGSYVTKLDLPSTASAYGPTQVSNKLYGASGQGGFIFEFDIMTGNFVNRFNFDFHTTGSQPNCSLALASNGKLYGVNQNDGANNVGVLFEFDPSNGNYTVKHNFSSSLTGEHPSGTLQIAPSGKIFGFTRTGGSNGLGVMYEFDPSSGILTKKIDFTGPNGSQPDLTVLTFIKEPQSVSFSAIPAKTIGDPLFDISASASATSSLPVTFTSSDPTIATVTNVGVIAILKSGEVTITASQAGDNTYGPASASQLLTINKKNQTITFETLPAKTFGDVAFDINPLANSNSALPISFTSSDQAVASITGTIVTILKAGTLTITAVQAGNESYNPALSVDKSLMISKASQNITFNAIADKTLGDASFAITGTSTSSLAVAFASSSDKITLTGSQVTLVKAGRATITASQTGNVNYSNATSVDKSFCIKPAKPSISVSTTSILTSSAASGNQWYFNGVVLAGAANQTVTATQAGIYKVQVKADDCISDFSADQSIIITGLENSSDNLVSIYPNPSSDWLTISFSDLKGIKETAIFSSEGKQKDLQACDCKEVKFSVKDYSKGIYFVNVTSENSIRTIKFVKQ